jgi:hypothetical protein
VFDAPEIDVAGPVTHSGEESSGCVPCPQQHLSLVWVVGVAIVVVDSIMAGEVLIIVDCLPLDLALCRDLLACVWVSVQVP